MLRTMDDLQRILDCDRIALNRHSAKSTIRQTAYSIFLPDYIIRFQRLLRKLEYLENQEQSPYIVWKRIWTYRKYKRLGQFLNFTIPPHVFGPGLSIAHIGTIVINKGARVGANCRIHVCVNVGTAAGLEHAAPSIGDNVYIGPGAKIFGPITIADGCAIGANAVVNKSFTEPNCLIGGVPAKVLGKVDTSKMLIRATEILANQQNN